MPKTSEFTTVENVDDQASCCGFSRLGGLNRISAVGLAIVAMLGVAGISYWLGTQQAPREIAMSEASQFLQDLPLVNATGAVTSEKFSMATGNVSDEAEGLFVLDHNSGLLQCSVIYPRSGQFMARFSTNVAETLGTGAKGGKYIMVTGRANFPRASNRPAAATVVYVMDSATGNYACYGIPFDQTAVPRNQPQQGLMVLIGAGSANPLVDRDDLR
ncbi:MAG: hypothetical protein L7U72_12125 [Rubripirellula sp.]|nr:hypothetical protein [Rubripirellula sp.]